MPARTLFRLLMILLICAAGVAALPPEPLAEMLPAARLVVVATVQRAQVAGPATVAGRQVAPRQQVTLTITRVLRGPALQSITVFKPAGGYALSAGNHGPFLLDGTTHGATILGRYGPDTWRLQDIEAALRTP